MVETLGNVVQSLVILFVFPVGLFLVLNSLVYEWAEHKILAQFQNRLGPRWYQPGACLLYTSPSPRDRTRSRMPSSA